MIFQATTAKLRSRLPERSSENTGPPDFRRLLGEPAWNRLARGIRSRFDASHGVTRPVVYTGCMQMVRCNLWGWLLAQLFRLLGTPVAPASGTDVPVEVKLFPSCHDTGIVWERTYHFPGRAPLTVRSTKTLDTDGSLLESLGAGLRMRLRVYERDGALHFRSRGYYLRVLGFSIALPDVLPPGETHVTQTDLGGSRFQFTLRITHPLLGEMFFQEGVFEDMRYNQ